jgi:AraC-like DNA-binding protein
MSRLLLIDTVFRLLSAGQLLLIALVVARGMAPIRIRAATVALLLCVAAYLANVAPTLGVRDSAVWPAVQLCSQATPLALWIFAHLIFERPIDRRIAIGSAAVTLICWGMIGYARYVTHVFPAFADATQHVLALLLAGHAIVIAVWERGDDLLEKRRAFRTGFVVVVGVQTFGIVFVETVFGYMRTLSGLMLLQSGTTLVSVLAFGAVMLSSNAELLFDAKAAPEPVRSPLSPSEHVLKQKLDAAMAEGGYRAPGLTIGGLAEQLGTPEHRLRALINQRLGFRNFSDFLNSQRIADARAWLADPAKVDLPVLTMAMDLGYGSLAPFNRAFRDATGQTPTDFRRAAIVIPENP